MESLVIPEVLKLVREEEIFAKFFALIGRPEITVELINHIRFTNGLILSPFRAEENRSCGFKDLRVSKVRRSGHNKYDRTNPGFALIMKDFAHTNPDGEHVLSPYFKGDCFDFVAKVLALNPTYLKETYNFPNSTCPNAHLELRNGYATNNILSQSLMIVLREIVARFGLTTNNARLPKYELAVTLDSIRKNAHTTFRVIRRPWNELDAEYWAKRGVLLKQLDLARIMPVQMSYLKSCRIDEEIMVYSYREDDPCYCYVLGKFNFEDREYSYFEFYHPNRKMDKKKRAKKFSTNCPLSIPFLQPWFFDQGLTYAADVLVITKSVKDTQAITAYNNEGKSLYFPSNKFMFRERQETDSPEAVSLMVVPVKHERGYVSMQEISIIKANYKAVVILVDPDKTGVICAAKLRKILKPHIPVTYVFFAKRYLGGYIMDRIIVKNTWIKDFSDCVSTIGIANTRNLIAEKLITLKLWYDSNTGKSSTTL